MPREYAKNWFSMWTDDDFTNQPVFDKLLFQVLLGQPPTMLNYAGVQTINLKRWRKAMSDGDQLPGEREMKMALIRMERRRYVFTDDDTSECLIRSFIRRDEVHKQPNVLLSALRAAAVIESPKLCAVMLDELKNRVELPEIKVQGSKNPEAAQRLKDNLTQTYTAAITHLERRAEGLPEALPEPFPEDFPEGLKEAFPRPAEIEPFPKAFPEGFREPPVVVEVEVSNSRPVVGHLGGTREAETETGTTTDQHPGDEPPTHCKKHRDDPNAADTNCGPCGNFRKAHDRWETRTRRTQAAAASTTAHTEAALKAEAIHACTLCDPDGYRPNSTVCDHNDHTATNTRGLQLARAALTRPTTEPTEEPTDA